MFLVSNELQVERCFHEVYDEVTGSCELPSTGAGKQTQDSLQVQSVFSAIESSLQPCILSFDKGIWCVMTTIINMENALSFQTFPL